MKKVAVYYRVSTDKQDLVIQQKEVQRWLTTNNILNGRVTVFTDEGFSGKTKNRPEYQRLMRLVEKGKIEMIVCYKLDRFSRSALDAVNTIKSLITDHGVRFVSVTQRELNLMPNDATSELIAHLFAYVAQIERETIVARVRAGQKAAMEAGKHCGRRTSNTPELIERVTALRARGLSYPQIVKETGLPKTRIYNIVNKDKLAGKVTGEDRAVVEKLRAQDKSYQQIADELKISVSRVYYIVNKVT